MNNKAIEDFVNKAQNVRMPDELDSTIHEAIKRGGRKMKIRKRLHNAMMVSAVILLIFSTFAVSVNMAPAFAAQVESLPGGEGIVKLLTFNRSTVDGGEPTDGKDIHSIEKEPGSKKTPDSTKDDGGKATDIDLQSEVIRIVLGDGEDDAVSLSHYEITYYEYPYSAIVYLSGVRTFSAAESLTSMEEGPLVKNAYRLITLDDSADRFAINFKKPVSIEVTEETDPAVLVLTINEKNADKDAKAVYSVRSESLPFGEHIAYIEEILRYQLNSQHTRMLQDDSGTYLVEEDYYASEEEAQAKIDEINELDSTLKLFIEKRTSEQLPKVIN